MSTPTLEEQHIKTLTAVRELAEGHALVSPKDLLAVLNGDFSPLDECRWLNQLCKECGHKRKSHSGYGGHSRNPHCQIIGRKNLTWGQEKAGKDDTLYCACRIYYKNMVPV